jgi:hypothetical protein
MLGKKTPEEISEFCDYDFTFVKKVQENRTQRGACEIGIVFFIIFGIMPTLKKLPFWKIHIQNGNFFIKCFVNTNIVS